MPRLYRSRRNPPHLRKGQDRWSRSAGTGPYTRHVMNQQVTRDTINSRREAKGHARPNYRLQ